MAMQKNEEAQRERTAGPHGASEPRLGATAGSDVLATVVAAGEGGADAVARGETDELLPERTRIAEASANESPSFPDEATSDATEAREVTDEVEPARPGTAEGEQAPEGEREPARKKADGGRGRTARPSDKRVRKNNVRKLRLERMMSKAELARRAAVSTLTIDRIERGLPCRMDTKRKILEALGLKPSDRLMVFGEDD